MVCQCVVMNSQKCRVVGMLNMLLLFSIKTRRVVVLLLFSMKTMRVVVVLDEDNACCCCSR